MSNGAALCFSCSLQRRLVLYVSIALLVVSMVGGVVIFLFAYEHEIKQAEVREKQMVGIVQAQAEVAVFAANVDIAQGVIDGLRANPVVLAVRIVSSVDAAFNHGEAADSTHSGSLHRYPLHSPVDGAAPIGTLDITRNDALIRADATLNALRQTLVMLLLTAIAALLIMLFSRLLIGQPVAELAAQIAAIRPGSGMRVPLPAGHEKDELGSLANSTNALIDAAEQALAEVQALATTDALTGLPNRRAFMSRLGAEHARLQRYAQPPASVLMIDIDHFKLVNDHYGHAAGDTVLKAFGALIQGEMRTTDYAGRLGGEEFAILLPDTTAAAALQFAERLRQRTADAAIPHGEIFLHVTISIGIAKLGLGDATADAVLVHADGALYRAKHGGRNRVEIESPPTEGAAVA